MQNSASKVSVWKKTLVAILITTNVFMVSPQKADAVILLLLAQAATPLIVKIVAEVILWCAAGIICGNGGGDGDTSTPTTPTTPPVVTDICDPAHPNHSTTNATNPNPTLSFANSSHWGTSPTSPAPGDQLRLSISSNPNQTCSYRFGSGSPSSIPSSNSVDFTAGSNATLGTQRTITVSCTTNQCSNNSQGTVNYTIPEVNINANNAFTSTPNVVRYNTVANLNWNITADSRPTYPLNCTISGAVANSPYSFTTRPSGSIQTAQLKNAFITTLRCTEPVSGTIFSTSTRTDVIPQAQEV